MRTIYFIVLFSASILSFSASATDVFPIRITGTVTWVADGDTFRFAANEPSLFRSLQGQAERSDAMVGRDLKVDQRFDNRNASFLVRVANIDTAESQHPDARRNSEAGRKAGAYVKELIQGVEGTVECYDIGYWGRPICSLWTNDLELGTHLIKKGYAQYETDYGQHPTMDSKYRQAMQH